MPGNDGAHDLHVDVSFRRAKIGEDAAAKVRFELAIRRAEVAFVIPPGEDVSVIQSSVAREVSASGTLEVRATQCADADLAAKGEASFGTTSSLSAQLSASTSLSRGKTETSTLTKPISEINWKQFKDPSSGNHTWEVSSADNGPMLGKPWDATSQPRLRFRTGGAKLPPSPRVMASCRRDDLLIEKIEVKNSSGWEKINSGFKKNRMAAAEAILKLMLERGDLDHGDVGEKFSTILIGDTIVSEEVI